MSFAEVHTLHLDFKRRLTSILGREVFPELTLTPPRGNSDELSFIRLVAWGYVLVFESGRGALSFLKNLPPLNDPDGASLSHLHALRTWASHNLVLDKKRDIKTIQSATMWLLEKCGTGSPASAEEWQKCFYALASDLENLLRRAIGSCDCFDKREDRADLIESFKKSLDRNWDAFVFDGFVEQAITKFGYQGISATDIRNANLDAWRKIVAVSSDDRSIERNLMIRVENDILALMSSSLSFTSDELRDILKPIDYRSITPAMLYLKNCAGEKLENLQEIIQELRIM